MSYTIQVECDSEEQRLLIEAALERRDVRGFAAVVGALRGLPTDRARRRVLEFVRDKLDEEQSARGV